MLVSREAGFPGSRPGTPRYQLATGIYGRVDRRCTSRLAEFLEDAWLSCHYRGWCSKGGTSGTSDDHVHFRSPLVHAVLEKVGVLLGDPQRLTGDELVVVAFGASKGVRTPFGRTAYDVRAAHRSGVEYEWVLIGPPPL